MSQMKYITVACSPQAIINSTITPNMTFTKTSQKFGQWADSRANTVYGLGFASEQHLSQVALDGSSLAWIKKEWVTKPWTRRNCVVWPLCCCLSPVYGIQTVFITVS